MTDTRKQIKELIEPYYCDGQNEPDITAVLKYIDEIEWIKVTLVWKDNISELVIQTDKCDYCETKEHILLGRIPNKPLKLYTEQELKHLLELLLKLKLG